MGLVKKIKIYNFYDMRGKKPTGLIEKCIQCMALNQFSSGHHAVTVQRYIITCIVQPLLMDTLYSVHLHLTNST